MSLGFGGGQTVVEQGQGPTSETTNFFISYGISNASPGGGPGWHNGTAPGAGGNIKIAGHRTGFVLPSVTLTDERW